MTNKKERKAPEFLKDVMKEWEENPLEEKLEDGIIFEPKTTKEHIIKLQELLVQTCIDFINENGLTDLYAVSFNADDLNTSAKEGKWTPATDSYISVQGIKNERWRRKNGEIFEMACRFPIGEYM